jgi:putative ABC transport system permease protein
MNILTITFNNIWHRKIRSLLTILGVGISIAAFVAIIGLTDGLRESFISNFKSRGTDLVVLEKGVLDILSSKVDFSYKDKLKAMPEIEQVAPILLDLFSFKFKQFIVIYGWELDSYLFKELKVQGSFPKNNQEVVLGALAAKRLNKKTGEQVNIKGVQFTVAGIFQSKSIIEDGAVIMALESLQKLKDVREKVCLFNIKVKIPLGGKSGYDQIDNSIDRAEISIARNFPELEVKNIQNFISNNTPMYMIFNFTWALSIVAFIIVILGIVNTMAASVLERTQEIGILLAIGWRNLSVVGMVLCEAMLLGLAGGIVGLGFGYLMMNVFVLTPQLSGLMAMTYDPVLVLKVIVISLALGLVSGIYPALKAISIEPMKVLRYG